MLRMFFVSVYSAYQMKQSAVLMEYTVVRI